uniref:Necrosis Inducing Protein 1 n=1 Tax=Siphoviridae sp. ctksc2 TaxID=2825645 RepID=A0A8S5URS6_9CAUD|nr:MAG TPA: Necrosis Inducing Protein 1 [Siphoviridae sp. ctksc2]
MASFGAAGRRFGECCRGVSPGMAPALGAGGRGFDG